MIKKFNKKILASLLVLATVVSTLFGAALPVSAAVQTVTFDDICNNVDVYVGGNIVDSADTDANGDLSFTITRSAGYTLIDVYLDDASVAGLTKTGESGNDTYYDIEDATGPVTVKILACTAYTGQTGLNGYTLNTAAQLNTLASTVNAGTTDYYGSYFLLTDNISLSGYSPWTPIGGHCTVSGYVPTGYYFAGVFDGDGHTISDISITASTAGYGGYGLFGYVNGGTIGNLTLSGSISLGNNVSFVGGVVGYLYGNVYSCHNQMSITCTAGSSNIGGIVGCAERILTVSIPAPNYIKCCSNSGNISGGGREGGIAGATYCHTSPQVDTGGIIVDCCFNSGNITCTQTSKTYAGGIVGYNSGYISNCYNSGTLTGNGSSYSIYLGGIAGMLTNGYGYACSQADNVYNSGNFANFKPGCAHYLFGWVDNDGVQITNGFWLAKTGVTKNAYGNWVAGTYGVVTEDQLKGIDWITANPYKYILDYLGSAFGLPIPPVYGYPFLQCQGSLSKPLIGGTPSSFSPCVDQSGAIFLDGVDGDDTYNGSTKTYTGGLNGPVQTFDRAKTLLSSATVKTIYIVNTVTVNSSESWTFTGSGIADPIVKRSCSCEGYLINVTTGGTLTLQGIVIDGNKANFVATTDSLIAVDAGSLVINSDVTLQNNAANGGGALRITGGAVTLGGGTITNCSAINYGGAVMILGNGAFTMNSGTITSNSATKGGGVAVIESGAFTLIGGTITASNNDAGVYVGDSTATFTIDPASTITFGANNIIYLTTGTKIWIASTLYGYVSSLTLEAEDEALYPVVAEGDGYTIDLYDDFPAFAYAKAGWYCHLNGSNQVYINQTP
jgi:hypothetical protein